MDFNLQRLIYPKMICQNMVTYSKYIKHTKYIEKFINMMYI
jgi:hypothetical protein